MTKKEYLKPAMTMTDITLNAQIMVNSVLTTGLEGDDLIEDETPGNSWGDAMSRRHNVWSYDDEEEDW